MKKEKGGGAHFPQVTVPVPGLHLHRQPPPRPTVTDDRSVQSHLGSHRLPRGLLLPFAPLTAALCREWTLYECG